MKLKKLLLVTFLVVVGVVKAYPQKEDGHKILDSLALKMFKDMNNRDYESIMDMTHPKIFDFASKEDMIGQIKSMIEGNEEFSVEIPKTIPEYKLSQLYTNNENNLDYAFVAYDFMMSMTFHNEEFDSESKELMKKMMELQGMAVKFISNNTVNLSMYDRITVLLKDEDTNNKWVMINYDANSPITFKLLPVEIIEKAKEYSEDLMIERKKNDKKNN